MILYDLYVLLDIFAECRKKGEKEESVQPPHFYIMHFPIWNESFPLNHEHFNDFSFWNVMEDSEVWQWRRLSSLSHISLWHKPTSLSLSRNEPTWNVCWYQQESSFPKNSIFFMLLDMERETVGEHRTAYQVMALRIQQKQRWMKLLLWYS